MSDSSELTDEEGRTYFDINLENVEDQRIAAEEYIAFLAQQEVKPSWWKELLQKIRMAFAKLPYFKDVRMTDKQIDLILARSARKIRKGGAYQAQDGGGVRFSVGGIGRPYYDIPFADSVDAVMNNPYSGNGSVFMRDTPQIFMDMGFSKLPIMTTAKHIKSIYSSKQTDEDHNHDLGELIKQIPEKLENPLMVITSETQPDTSVVVILELTDKNNNAVVVPILLNGRSYENKIDAHIMTFAYGKKIFFQVW